MQNKENKNMFIYRRKTKKKEKSIAKIVEIKQLIE